MGLVSDSSLGIEEIMDSMALVLMSDVNSALATVYERRLARDEALAIARGIEFVELEYEDIPSNHVHIGNFPSLALDEIGKEEYPYLALTLEDYAPDPEDAAQDHMSVFRDGIVIHAFAAATDDEGSEVVFRRACRMAEAVFITISSNAQTQKLLSGLSNPVRGRPSVPWRYQYQGHGEDWWFQAVGTQYQIKSYTSIHS